MANTGALQNDAIYTITRNVLEQLKIKIVSQLYTAPKIVTKRDVPKI
jgi:hypothetical protein